MFDDDGGSVELITNGSHAHPTLLAPPPSLGGWTVRAEAGWTAAYTRWNRGDLVADLDSPLLGSVGSSRLSGVRKDTRTTSLRQCQALAYSPCTESPQWPQELNWGAIVKCCGSA